MSESRRPPSGVVVGIIRRGVIHFVVALALFPIGVLVYGQTSLGVSSWDQLSGLGPGLQFAIAGAWVPALVTPFVAYELQQERRPRTVALWGMCTSVALCLVAVPFLHAR